MDHKKEAHKDFIVKYSLMKDKLPPDFSASVEKYLELSRWWFEELPAWLKESTPMATKLMLQQYPVIKTSLHKEVRIFTDEINDAYMWRLHGTARGAIREQAERVNLQEKYPKWEEWRAFYGKPEEPHYMTDSLRNPHLHTNDEEWEKEKAEENRKILLIHQWHEKRKEEFYDMMLPLLYKHLPALNELDGDYMLNFGIRLRDNYEEWKGAAEHIETIVEYGMPPESLELDTDEFQKAFHPYFLKEHKRLGAQRDKIIFGVE